MFSSSLIWTRSWVTSGLKPNDANFISLQRKYKFKGDVRTAKQSNSACITHAQSLLQWRHNGHEGVSNHQPHVCLLNLLFRRRSKKTSKLRVTGICEGNSPVTREFPTQMGSDTESVSIWWCHNDNLITDASSLASITGILRNGKGFTWLKLIWQNHIYLMACQCSLSRNQIMLHIRDSPGSIKLISWKCFITFQKYVEDLDVHCVVVVIIPIVGRLTWPIHCRRSGCLCRHSPRDNEITLENIGKIYRYQAKAKQQTQLLSIVHFCFSIIPHIFVIYVYMYIYKYIYIYSTIICTTMILVSITQCYLI